MYNSVVVNLHGYPSEVSQLNCYIINVIYYFNLKWMLIGVQMFLGNAITQIRDVYPAPAGYMGNEFFGLFLNAMKEISSYDCSHSYLF